MVVGSVGPWTGVCFLPRFDSYPHFYDANNTSRTVPETVIHCGSIFSPIICTVPMPAPVPPRRLGGVDPHRRVPVCFISGNHATPQTHKYHATREHASRAHRPQALTVTEARRLGYPACQVCAGHLDRDV